MKTAIYIEQGITQIVLTPETSLEESVIKLLSDPNKELEVKFGSFYHCQGGWVRESAAVNSAMLVLRPVVIKEEDPT